MSLTALLMSCTLTGHLLPRPTQTPVLLVVTGQTPSIVQDSSTPSAFPTPLSCRAGVIEQPFEHGRMFWLGKAMSERCSSEHDFAPGSGEILVVIFDTSGTRGTWTVYDDTWQEDTDAESDPLLTPPAGLIQPIRGFGRVWRDELSQDQRTALGWATNIEVPYETDYRYDSGGLINEQGTYIPRPGQDTIVTIVGEKFFLDEQTNRFDYIPAP